jgi:ubiquinone/menaquinone biosynthesis C-methylase UbiE
MRGVEAAREFFLETEIPLATGVISSPGARERETPEVPSKMALALRERLYRHQIGGTPLFRRLITDRLRADRYVLDLGCGKGRESTDVRSAAALVVGCDIGEEVCKNSFVSACVRGDAQMLPFRDGSFGAVIMDYVVEHLEYPDRCATETFRVLRRGGYLFLRTPNLHHYVSIVGCLTSHGFHRRVANPARGLESSTDADVFKTFYRANTRRTVERVFGQAGFVPKQILLVEREPSYLMFSGAAFLVGYCYERLVNMSETLATFRSNIFAVLRKPVS